MTTGIGIAGAMSYQPREAGVAPNECTTCGKDFGEGASKVAAAIPGIGLVQYCSRECAPARSPAEEWQWMVERIRALEEALREARYWIADDPANHQALILPHIDALLTSTDKGES